ncbi:hypothetical protein CAC42_2640 [Sphaceloma murrayae]|uniref:Uncharacterized protein n=1 Tax=Sphaceloma murrayae TaxID=2082308 RepID=A0A2K1QIB1_9PEZI|nr:hypothetical protein CAC42_2640 [Sphaceloma murrayae]
MTDSDDDPEIEVKPTAASDRTHLSDEAFAATKADYVAKHDNGRIFESLPEALPSPYRAPAAAVVGDAAPPSDIFPAKPSLTNKHIQLVSAAAGELYYFKDYEKLLEMIAWLREGYDVEGSGRGKGKSVGKLVEALERWERRCRERLSEQAVAGK